MSDTVFRTPRWFRILAGASFALLLGGFIFAASRGEPFYTTAGMGVFAALFALGFADALTTRVELRDDALVVVTNFRTRVVPKAQIASVTWAAGAGLALALEGGRHVRLPDVGNSQGRTNTIRAWLKRSDNTHDRRSS